MRNYDTTNSLPYPRVTEVQINYTASGQPSIVYFEQMAIVDSAQTVHHLDGQKTRHTLDLSQMTEPVAVVSPATGLVIPGKTVMAQDLMLGLLAFLRADQVRRDAQV